MYATINDTMDQEKSQRSYGRMIFLGIVLVMPIFLSSVSHAYPAIALPHMQLDMSVTSWFASVSTFVSPLSVIIVGFLIDRFGRKTAILYCITPSIGGWLLLYWDYSVPLILFAQVLNGLTMSTSYYPVQAYAGECIMVDNPRLRNVFMAWINLSVSLGSTATLIMGNIFSYHEICLILAVINISMLVIFSLAIPESPVWLYRQGRIGDAEWSQKRLGITHSTYISTMKTQMQQDIHDKKSYYRKQLQKLSRPDVYKPTFILSFVFILLSWCGATTIVTYMINVIQNTIPGTSSQITEISNQTNDVTSQALSDYQDELQLSYQLSLYCGACMCLGSLLSVITLPRLGLKKMLITANSFLIIAMLIILYGTEMKPEDNIMIRVAGVSLVAFCVGVEIGPRMAFIGDVFPVDAKGFASVPTLCGLISKATCYKMFPYLRFAFGGYVYCIFATVSFIAAICIHFLVPEVVGKNLEDINKEYADDIKK